MASGTTALAVSATGKSGAISSALGIGSLKKSQLEILQNLVSKHVIDPSLMDVANSEDFTVTSLERGIPRYEHAHLVAALDVLLMYQRNRRAQGSYTFLPSMRSNFRHDPRTRLIELYKRWLRTHAASASLSEDDVRRMCALCRDILNHPRLFPSRNPLSFMHSLAEVYDHLKLQLREVLERDRTCADLAGRALCLSRNLISDAISYLLLAPTDLKQTDKLPSLEVVYLWQSLPADMNPLPGRADPALQKLMKEAWLTYCGSLVASLLSVRWSFKLFDGSSAEDEAAATFAVNTEAIVPSDSKGGAGHPAEALLTLIGRIGAEFEKGNFKTSGLAGAFREPGQKAGRQSYLVAIEAMFDLIFMLGDVLVQFHRISDALGDYGMIRVSPWLHPFLEALVEKVQRLRGSLEALNEIVDAELVLAKARGQKVKKPAPTQMMCARAHASIDRAIVGSDCHAQLLLQVFDELRLRSAPERLPHVMEGLGDACTQLQQVLTSPQFLARVGDSFRDLPPLGSVTDVSKIGDMPTTVAIEDVDGEMSEEELSPNQADAVAQKSSDPSPTITGFHVRQRAASAGRAGKAALLRLATRRQDELPDDAARNDAENCDASPSDFSGLPADGWICHETSKGRKFWHNVALGPPPWEPKGEASLEEDEDGGGAEGRGPEHEKSDAPADAGVLAPAVSGGASGAGTPSTSGARAEEQKSSRRHEGRDVQAEVYRLTVAMKGWKRHDCRSLLLTKDGELRIFEKGSRERVKTIVRVEQELEMCSLLGDGILSMQIRRSKSAKVLCGGGAARGTLDDKECLEPKIYLFEFCQAELAETFHAELTSLRASSFTKVT